MKKKPELLCPAGDMESLKQAINNGADAIYLGIKNFGARKFAHNFDDEELQEALKLCHLYGVKLYVTMNTLIKTNETEDFLEKVGFLHKLGVDAILMQDFGMINIVRKMYPNLEIHASTQANNSSIDIARMFYNIGVKRVVVSRELSLDEINKIDVPIEIEAFVHGALCISYSGCCLMSSMIGGRSGNRGECAGSCRLPYSLSYNNEIIEDNKYLISTKELNSSTKIEELLNSNISSLKIEGRMKSPEYVGFITKYYRNLIDKNKNYNLEEETNKLRTIFNREFTTGHLFNATPDELMNNKTPNHIGLEIGKVLEVTPKKIKIKLNRELNQEDGIRFKESGKGLIVNYLYDEKDRLISSSNNICYVDNKINLETLDTVSKTLDFKLMNSLKKYDSRKVNVKINLTAKVGKKLLLEISDDKNKVQVEGNIVEKSINSPISKERIITQLEKLGDTPFISTNTIVDMDENIFISIKILNDLRREATLKLVEIRSNKNVDFIKNNVEFSKISLEKTSNVNVSVKTKEQLEKCLELNIDSIYIDDKELYNKYKNTNKVYYKLPRCSFDVSKNIETNSIVNDYFDFNNGLIGNYGLNVYNIYTAYYLYKMGIKRITLSPELSLDEITQFIYDFKNKFETQPNIEVLTYGLVENMIIKDNILNLNINDYNYKLIDLRKREFNVYFDGVNTHILNFENKGLDITKIKENINIRLDFYNETPPEIEMTVNKYL